MSVIYANKMLSWSTISSFQSGSGDLEFDLSSDLDNEGDVSTNCSFLVG